MRNNIEFLAQDATGCESTGMFRKVNCTDKLAMLNSVIADSQEKIDSTNEEFEIMSQTLNGVASDLEEAGGISQGDQTQAAANEIFGMTCALVAVCPGGKIGSTACQARLGFLADGQVKEFIEIVE